MTFYEIYEKHCKDLGIAPVSQAAADAIGCSKSTISSLAKTGQTPKGETIVGIAKMLNISADYLLGLCDSPVPISKKLSNEEIELLRLFDELNDDGKVALLALVRGLSAEPLYKKDNSPVSKELKDA